MNESLEQDEVALEALVGQVADEFTERLNRGEQPNVEEYAARYPQLAAVLRQVLPALQVMGSSARPTGDGEHAGEPALPPVLGDFRLVREIGRGGMGIVYEAEQVSLGRRVALKVLPFAGTLDPRQLQRFRNEAQAAAQLHHTHIVPVYWVGCERGVHYYAMQFIDGQNLAAIIRELRQVHGVDDRDVKSEEGTATAEPGLTAAASSLFDPKTPIHNPRSKYFRTVAQLGIHAAEALDHAHEQGVVHRDIKPANLLVDGAGKLWVSDFGLARFQHGEASLTLTGDLVGTIRYMSPEQARARRVVVDHRTDVYSLGVTLYELLTLTPAFAGTDRQELLRQIMMDEPRLPRRLNRAIPAELETIVLKAMEKNPEDRYGTAREMAEDLRRLLEHKPLLARPPTVLMKARKWAQRHQSVARLSAFFFALALCGLSVSSALLWRAWREADQQRALAEDRLDYAQLVVERTFTSVSQNLYREDPRLQEPRRQFLQDVLEFYKEFARVRGDDWRAGASLAKAHGRLASVHLELRQYKEAEEEAKQALVVFEALARDLPSDANIHADLIDTNRILGKLYWTMERHDESVEAVQRAVQLKIRLPGASPADPDYRSALASLHNELGIVLKDAGQDSRAETSIQRAIDITRDLIKDDPSVAKHHSNLGASLNSLAQLLAGNKKRDRACQCLEEAIVHQEVALQADPHNPHFRGFLRNHWWVLCRTFLQLGDHARASKAAEKLPQILPQGDQYGWATTYLIRCMRLARRDQQLAPEARVRVQRAYGTRVREMLAEAKKWGVSDPEVQIELAWQLADLPYPELRDPIQAVTWARMAVERAPRSGPGWHALGLAHFHAGAWKEAVEALGKAQAFGSPDLDAHEFFMMAIAHGRLGEKLQGRRRYDEAMQWICKPEIPEDKCRDIRVEAERVLGIERYSTAR